MNLRTRYRPHLIGLACIACWAVFAVAYLGREDGSSGLSLLGWISFAFYLPGVLILTASGGALSNDDLVLAAVLSWLIYSLMAVVVAQVVQALRREPASGRASDQC